MKIFLCVLFLIPVFLFGQKVKKVTTRYKNPDFKEVYYVSEKDNSIKEGNFQKLGYNDMVLINGYFKNGLKDSIWNYYWFSDHLKMSGIYKMDKREGLWEFYDRRGVLVQKFDYSKLKLEYAYEDTIQPKRAMKIIAGKDTLKVIPDRPPVYIGSSVAIFDFISQNFKWDPNSAQDIKGAVVVGFVVDKNGKTRDHHIIRGLGSCCDEISLDMIKKLPDEWVPGVYKGDFVDMEVTQRFGFESANMRQ